MNKKFKLFVFLMMLLSFLVISSSVILAGPVIPGCNGATPAACNAINPCCQWINFGCVDWCASSTNTCGSGSDCQYCGSPGGCEYYGCTWDYQGTSGCLDGGLTDFTCFEDADKDTFVNEDIQFTLRGTDPNYCYLDCDSMTVESCSYAPDLLCGFTGSAFCNGWVDCSQNDPSTGCGSLCTVQTTPASSYCMGSVDCSDVSSDLCEFVGCDNQFECTGNVECNSFSTFYGCSPSAPSGCTSLGMFVCDGSPSCSNFNDDPIMCNYFSSNGCSMGHNCQNTAYTNHCNVFSSDQSMCTDVGCTWVAYGTWEHCAGSGSCGAVTPLTPANCNAASSACQYYSGTDCYTRTLTKDYISQFQLPILNGGIDCDDNNPSVHPGAIEICSGGGDEDCDGMVDCADSNCIGSPLCPCGNGIINAGEQCDGANLNGKNCATVIASGWTGTLACNSTCRFNTTLCIPPPAFNCTVNSDCTNPQQYCNLTVHNCVNMPVCAKRLAPSSYMLQTAAEDIFNQCNIVGFSACSNQYTKTGSSGFCTGTSYSCNSGGASAIVALGKVCRLGTDVLANDGHNCGFQNNERCYCDQTLDCQVGSCIADKFNRGFNASLCTEVNRQSSNASWNVPTDNYVINETAYAITDCAIMLANRTINCLDEGLNSCYNQTLAQGNFSGCIADMGVCGINNIYNSSCLPTYNCSLGSCIPVTGCTSDSQCLDRNVSNFICGPSPWGDFVVNRSVYSNYSCNTFVSPHRCTLSNTIVGFIPGKNCSTLDNETAWTYNCSTDSKEVWRNKYVYDYTCIFGNCRASSSNKTEVYATCNSSNETCVNGACVAIPPVGCVFDSDCADDYYMWDANYCSDAITVSHDGKFTNFSCSLFFDCSFDVSGVSAVVQLCNINETCSGGSCVCSSAIEICGDGIDNNCDGSIDEGCTPYFNNTNCTGFVMYKNRLNFTESPATYYVNATPNSKITFVCNDSAIGAIQSSSIMISPLGNTITPTYTFYSPSMNMGSGVMPICIAGYNHELLFYPANQFCLENTYEYAYNYYPSGNLTQCYSATPSDNWYLTEGYTGQVSCAYHMYGGYGAFYNIAFSLNSQIFKYECSNNTYDGVCPTDFNSSACTNTMTNTNITDLDCGKHLFIKCLDIHDIAGNTIGNTCDHMPNISDTTLNGTNCSIQNIFNSNKNLAHAQCALGAVVMNENTGCPTCLKSNREMTYSDGITKCVRPYENKSTDMVIDMSGGAQCPGLWLVQERIALKTLPPVMGVYPACPSLKYNWQQNGSTLICIPQPLECDQGYRTATSNNLTKKCNMPLTFNITTGEYTITHPDCLVTNGVKYITYCGLNSWVNNYELYDDNFKIMVK